jgi:hypothetical protein
VRALRGKHKTAPPGFESAGGAVDWAMSRPTVLDRTAGYPLQQCWCSVTPRFLHSGVAVAESADSTFRRSRRARGRGRISDTRVFRAPAVTKLGTALSVERDMADRPVHDRTRVRDGRPFSSPGARPSLGRLVDLVTPRSTMSYPHNWRKRAESTKSRHRCSRRVNTAEMTRITCGILHFHRDATP